MDGSGATAGGNSMIRALLRKGDGLSGGRPWLKSVVKNAQLALVDAGHLSDSDGKFGNGTEKAVGAFQTAAGVAPSGTIDKDTWAGLEIHLQAATSQRAEKEAEFLKGFDGDLEWIHEKEGHRGKPYWPGGISGVTLDPGVDLGHATAELVEQLYGSLLNKRELKALSAAFGLKGQHARDALNALPAIQAIRISREQSSEVLPFAARPYWNQIVSRFRALTRKDTPGSVQTALLSLSYNRGPFNRGLEPLGEPLQNRQWSAVATTIGSMQQQHKLKGIRIRRRHEALTIEAELELINS